MTKLRKFRGAKSELVKRASFSETAVRSWEEGKTIPTSDIRFEFLELAAEVYKEYNIGKDDSIERRKAIEKQFNEVFA